MHDQLSRTNIPSVLNTKPRRVKFIGKTGWGLLAARLFILPHALIGLALVGVVILGPFWVLHGTDYTAKVVDISVQYGSGSKKNTYYLTYAHSPFGEERRKNQSVPLEEFSRVVGTTDGSMPPVGPEGGVYKDVRVRGWGKPPFYYEQIVGPTESPWEYYIGPAIMCVFWNGLLFVFVKSVYLTPRQVRRLYSHGDVDPGILVNKWASSGKSPSYLLSYEFKVNGVGETIHGQAEFRDKASYDAAMIGQVVTVLHPPGSGKRSAAYEFGLYTCE